MTLVHDRWKAAEAARAALPVPAHPSALEAAFAAQIAHAGLPAPAREHRFALPRRFAFDFAWPLHLVAVELDGGSWSGGRHTRGSGFERDTEKRNLAQLLGWMVLHFTATTVRSGDALRFTTAALRRRSPCQEPAG